MEEKEIKDREAILKLIQSSFQNLPVYTETSKGKIPIKVVSIKEEGVVVQNYGSTEKVRTLCVTNNGNVLSFDFSLIGSNANYEILSPVLLRVAPAKRLGERIDLNDPMYFITSITNQNEISKSLNFDSVKLKNLLGSYTAKVKDKFSFLDIYISDRQDFRLKLIGSYDKPIFIPDKADPTTVTSDFVPYSEYIVHSKFDKKYEKYVSEICIPLRYKNFISFGYISAFNLELMDNSHYNMLNIIANSLKKELLLSSNIIESKEKAKITNVSNEGFAFDHNNTVNFSKLFVIGSIIIFDFHLSDTEKQTVRATVRNIRPTEKSYRIGCQFYVQYPEEKKSIEELIKYCVPK
jgi:hypothetical protein